jgi:pimeloyl-ACP methyl ester carboxylesterase
MDVILIPGFWLDAASWDDMVPALQRAGHRTHALTLPGMHEGDADPAAITLRDHVDAVIAAIDAIDPGAGPVALVGHSAGGLLAHAAVDARPDRVARVVYVDCLPPGDGGIVNDALPVVDGLIPLPDWSFFGPEDLAGLDEDLRAALRARAIPVPARVSRDAVHLSDERRLDVPVTVIACEFTAENLRDGIAQGEPWAAELGRIRDVTVVDLPTGHWPQLTRPADLAAALVGALAT